MCVKGEWKVVQRNLREGHIMRMGEMAICGEWKVIETLYENGKCVDTRTTYEPTQKLDVGRFTGGTGDELAYLFKVWEAARTALELRLAEHLKNLEEANDA